MCITLSLVAQVTKVPARKLSRCPMGEVVTFIYLNLHLVTIMTLNVHYIEYLTNFVKLKRKIYVYSESQNVQTFSKKIMLNVKFTWKKYVESSNHVTFLSLLLYLGFIFFATSFLLSVAYYLLIKKNLWLTVSIDFSSKNRRKYIAACIISFELLVFSIFVIKF